ncbi:MAG: response regulator [Bacteroidota bacterium]
MPLAILVVDDEVLVEKMIRSRFRKEIKAREFAFHFALNGQAALAVIEAHPEIGILLCDINMPVMDGLTLLAELRDKPRLLRIIMVTAYGNMDNIRAAMNQGAFDFITKPIDFADLKTTIHKAHQELEQFQEGEAARRQLPITQEQLEKTDEKARHLEELDQVKTRFFANISHEFRTPLTVIRGMVDQIQDKPEQYLSQGTRMIRRNTDQLLDLVNQVLDLQKLEAGKLQLSLVQADLVSFVKYLAEPFQVLAGQKGISFQVSSEAGDLWMDYDPAKLLRILSNLLSNAIKFTPEGGEVRVNIQVLAQPDDQPKRLHLEVSDTGRGIPAGKLSSIFDRFYQVDPSDTREGEGTGIGLSLTQELVELMDGRIEVKSQEGKGTTFAVLLPITREASAEEMGDAPAPLSLPALSQAEGVRTVLREDLPRLLIIEDNPDIRTYLIACLEEEYALIVARDGEEGINKALDMTPDLIVSDVMMPKKDGYEVCATLKQDERTSHIPIVLLTAKSDTSSKIEGLKQGADAYLAKPFNKEELFIRLEKLLELRKQLQRRYAQADVRQLPESANFQQEDAFLRKVCDTIDALMESSTINVPAICQYMGTSRSNLHRKITALTGESATNFVNTYRLEKAKELLGQPEENISDIAYKLGFSDPGYFTKLFSRRHGLSPSKMRESLLAGE